MRARLLAATLLLPLAGCELLTAGECPLSAEPAVVVFITDAVTGEPRASGASGFVRDGAFVDSLLPAIFDGNHTMLARQAAVERPGEYDITVSHPGYATWMRLSVEVDDGGCNVETREIDAKLRPTESVSG